MTSEKSFFDKKKSENVSLMIKELESNLLDASNIISETITNWS